MNNLKNILKNTTPTFRNAMSNLTWLSFDRVVRTIGAVFVNVIITRYLGPENFGILNYAIAFAGIFTPIIGLGLNAIVIRDIVRNVENKDEILGTAFVLRKYGGVVAIIFSAVGIFLIKPDDYRMQILVIITSIGLAFQAFEVIDFWFQSQVQSKYTVIAKNLAFFIIAIFKIIFVLLNADILVFIILGSIEFVVAALALIYMYKKSGNTIRKWKYSSEQAKYFLASCWPIIISDIAVFAQIRIDQIMIGHFLSNKELGFYAAAQRLSEPLGFIPMIILTSVYPVFLKIKEKSEKEFYERLTNLYRLMFILTILICLPISFFSEAIVNLLYGKEFLFSASILSLLIWTRFYAFYGVARSIVISADNLFTHTLISSSCGVTVNLISNYFLIPKIGIVGAIISTHLSFIVTIFLFDAFAKKTQTNFKAMIYAMLTFYKFKLK
ncbi:MAG: flippase [Bacteroidota bacterium]